METADYLTGYYESHDEDARLRKNHGLVEYDASVRPHGQQNRKNRTETYSINQTFYISSLEFQEPFF